MLTAWLLGVACNSTGGDSVDTARQEAPLAWTQVDLQCSVADHAWEAWASGLAGRATLRLVPRDLETSEVEEHPLVVADADPGGTWTLLAAALELAGAGESAVPGFLTTHDCRAHGQVWTWSLTLEDDDSVLDCVAWQPGDTGLGQGVVATCD